ncbi:hypothetical protein [Acidisoma silvae]|uniref:Uncharacterized protein n=1 Tax=Acidisoma silvae TaxID=2802396 RepID=A0A963YR41_9PROT|nr:hypothetical protein [Acidisoma silvae]MCB8875452.1 hypothetical protein [Acidisoma silvae]
MDSIVLSAPDRPDQAAIARAAVDGVWYRSAYPDVASAAIDPVDHYLAFGWQEERWPNPAFDPFFYLSQLPSRPAGDPLLHYLHHGESAGHRPISWFDQGWYRTAQAVPEGDSCLIHYLNGRRGGRLSPNRRFDPVYYAAQNPDVAEAGIDLFEHYLHRGRQEGRLPRDEREIVRESGLVDANYYYINGPDVHQAGLDAVDHYAAEGWREHRRPNPYFDGVWYRQRYNPPQDMSPLCHYVLEGEALGHRPSLYFDPAWYRSTYGLDADQTALTHYLEHRATRRFSPLPIFDIDFYVKTYAADLGRARDIFAHYLAIGAMRDFNPASWFKAAEYRQQHMNGQPPPPAATGEVARNPLLHFLCSYILAAAH